MAGSEKFWDWIRKAGIGPSPDIEATPIRTFESRKADDRFSKRRFRAIDPHRTVTLQFFLEFVQKPSVRVLGDQLLRRGSDHAHLVQAQTMEPLGVLTRNDACRLRGVVDQARLAMRPAAALGNSNPLSVQLESRRVALRPVRPLGAVLAAVKIAPDAT